MPKVSSTTVSKILQKQTGFKTPTAALKKFNRNAKIERISGVVRVKTLLEKTQGMVTKDEFGKIINAAIDAKVIKEKKVQELFRKAENLEKKEKIQSLARATVEQKNNNSNNSADKQPLTKAERIKKSMGLSRKFERGNRAAFGDESGEGAIIQRFRKEEQDTDLSKRMKAASSLQSEQERKISMGAGVAKANKTAGDSSVSDKPKNLIDMVEEEENTNGKTNKDNKTASIKTKASTPIKLAGGAGINQLTRKNDERTETANNISSGIVQVKGLEKTSANQNNTSADSQSSEDDLTDLDIG